MDVKYPFCSLAADVKWEGSGRSSSILVISILKAQCHQTIDSLGCINRASEEAETSEIRKAFALSVAFVLEQVKKIHLARRRYPSKHALQVRIYFCRNVELNKKENVNVKTEVFSGTCRVTGGLCLGVCCAFTPTSFSAL